MLFSKKSPSLFVDLNDHTFALARTSSSGTQLVIEEMKSCPAGDASAIASLLESKTARRGGVAGLTHAACAIYPRRRLVRRATLDPKRFR